MENVKGYLDEVLQICKNENCSYLLIEEQLEGPRLNTFKVYEIASEGSVHASGFFKAIAYVDVNAEGILMEFAEKIASQRDLPVKVFQTVTEAEEWLIDKSEHSS